MLNIFSSNPFYSHFVSLPDADTPLSSEIRNNNKFWPYFKKALGALDGSHFASSPPSYLRDACRNRKGFVSQNCLFACNFAFYFVYALTGWEGSAMDARVWDDARENGGFIIPDGYYYLADAGYPLCRWLLTPYRGVRYHLAEWGRAHVRFVIYPYTATNYMLTTYLRPQNKEELFNLRHASAQNVIERIFGVLKHRFRILYMAPEYSMDIQARIPAALAAIHNFIRIHDPETNPIPDEDHNTGHANDADHRASSLEAERQDDISDVRRDEIAQAMWDDYLAYHAENRGESDDDIGDNDNSDNISSTSSTHT